VGVWHEKIHSSVVGKGMERAGRGECGRRRVEGRSDGEKVKELEGGREGGREQNRAERERERERVE
jgi:hypothetical protein